jgi:translation initiation factor 1
MANKKINSLSALVYSTDPEYKLEKETLFTETTIAANQPLKIRIDKKHRAGKAVTLIEGFEGKVSDLQELGKKIKTFCGTGGSVKDGEIMVQGDNRDKILQWLVKNGYTLSKKIQ